MAPQFSLTETSALSMQGASDLLRSMKGAVELPQDRKYNQVQICAAGLLAARLLVLSALGGLTDASAKMSPSQDSQPAAGQPGGAVLSHVQLVTVLGEDTIKALNINNNNLNLNLININNSNNNNNNNNSSHLLLLLTSHFKLTLSRANLIFLLETARLASRQQMPISSARTNSSRFFPGSTTGRTFYDAKKEMAAAQAYQEKLEREGSTGTGREPLHSAYTWSRFLGSSQQALDNLDHLQHQRFTHFPPQQEAKIPPPDPLPIGWQGVKPSSLFKTASTISSPLTDWEVAQGTRAHNWVDKVLIDGTEITDPPLRPLRGILDEWPPDDPHVPNIAGIRTGGVRSWNKNRERAK
eukprot:g59495.t1